jgi:hypothetical protein
MSYEIVRYMQEHQAEVAELERILWRGDAAENVAHLHWKYRDGPLSEHTHLFVALAGKAVVGVRGLVAGRWELSSASGARPVTFLAPSGADLVIAPEHRNTGLYRLLTEQALSESAKSGYPLAFNFSASSANRLASLAAGWRQAFAVPEHAHRPRQGITRWLGLVRGKDADAWHTFTTRALAAPSDGRVGHIAMRETAGADELAALVARAKWDGGIRQRRDAAFFRWRFSGPKCCHRFVTCHGDGGLRGYVVLQARRHRPGHVMLVDHEADSAEVLDAVLNVAVRWAASMKVVAWNAAPCLRDGAVLETAGFEPMTRATGVRAEGPRVLWRALDRDALAAIERDTGRDFRRAADWDLRPAYSDAF